MAKSPNLAIAADRTILAPNFGGLCSGPRSIRYALDYTDKLFDYAEKDIDSARFCAYHVNCCRIFFAP